jgi:hypothetical protein
MAVLFTRRAPLWAIDAAIWMLDRMPVTGPAAAFLVALATARAVGRGRLRNALGALLVAVAMAPGAALAQSGSPTDPLTVTGITALPTYGAGVSTIALTGAGDLACIEGSATSVVRVKGFQISAIASSAIVVDLAVVLRSSLDTGGTPTAPTPVPFDPANPPATAVFRVFSTAPTPGTLVGTIRTAKLAVGTQGQATGAIGDARFSFFNRFGQAIMLRDASHAACVTVTAAGNGASYDFDAEWTETAK